MKKILSLIFIIFSLSLFSDPNDPGWKGKFTIDQLVSYPDNNLILVYVVENVSLSGVDINGETRNGNTGSFYLYDEGTDSQISRVYAMLIAAKLSGEKVALNYTGKLGPWNYHEVGAVKF